MCNLPSNRPGTRFRRKVRCLLAGVRFLLADRPGSPAGSRLFELVGRLTVTALCFWGGLLIADHFAGLIAASVHKAGLEWIVLPAAVFVVFTPVVLVPLLLLRLRDRLLAWCRRQCERDDA